MSKSRVEKTGKTREDAFKKLEAAYKDSEKKYWELINLLPLGIFEYDLNGRVSALRCDIKKLPPRFFKKNGFDLFDLAVSNPPFRKPLSGRLNIDKERAVARHEIEIDLKGLLKAASGLLRARGRFCMVYHPLRLTELMEELKKVRLEPKRLRFIHGNTKAEAKMFLMEAVKDGRPGLKVENPLFVYKEDGGYTEEMEGIYGA